MTVYISLLRGINVGGSKILSMETLCNIYTGLGFAYVRTYLQSGNVVFASPRIDRKHLAQEIESQIENVCGFHAAAFIHTSDEFGRIIQDNPFLKQRNVDLTKLHVAFLYQPPSEATWIRLDVPRDIPDKYSRGEQAIYLYHPNGTAKAKISTAYLEKLLGVPLTNRNWNTVNALYKIAMNL